MSFIKSLLFGKQPAKKTLVYAVTPENRIRDKADWTDYGYLGLAVFAVHADWFPEDRQFYAFTKDDGFLRVESLIREADEIVSFNGLEFGDKLCAAYGINLTTTYDLMVEVRRAAGEPLSGICRRGYNLEQLAQSNLGFGITPSCPGNVRDLWKRGKRETVIDYSINLVSVVRALYLLRKELRDPVIKSRVLYCDSRLINWDEIKANINHFWGERMINVDTMTCVHWTGANLVQLHIFIGDGGLSIRFPIWIKPKQDWRKYTGLPFKKEPTVIKLKDGYTLTTTYVSSNGIIRNNEGKQFNLFPEQRWQPMIDGQVVAPQKRLNDHLNDIDPIPF